jgi:hypothetical protein
MRVPIKLIIAINPIIQKLSKKPIPITDAIFLGFEVYSWGGRAAGGV